MSDKQCSVWNHGNFQSVQLKKFQTEIWARTVSFQKSFLWGKIPSVSDCLVGQGDLTTTGFVYWGDRGRRKEGVRGARECSNSFKEGCCSIYFIIYTCLQSHFPMSSPSSRNLKFLFLSVWSLYMEVGLSLYLNSPKVRTFFSKGSRHQTKIWCGL